MRRRDVGADRRAGEKGNAFLFHDTDSSIDNIVLVELHIRDAVHQQSSDSIIAFVDRDPMPGFVELRGSGEASRPGTDHGNLASCADLRRLRNHPAHFERMIDNRTFDILNRNRWFDHGQATGTFAGSRTDSTGELRKIVRLVQSVQCVAPAALVNKIVPFGDEVIDRASGGHIRHQIAGMTKRHAAIHAPRPLNLEVSLGHVFVELIPIQNAQQRITVRGDLSCVFFEASGLSHGTLLSVRSKQLKKICQASRELNDKASCVGSVNSPVIVGKRQGQQ